MPNGDCIINIRVYEKYKYLKTRNLIVGDNGSGKTTLIDCLINHTEINSHVKEIEIEGRLEYLKEGEQTDIKKARQDECMLFILRVQQILLAKLNKNGCPKCGSSYYDEDNNVKRCVDCYEIYLKK